ncbi:shikimate kinase [Microbacterium sp.]|jgi:shikimate kinase|uniref:shikimate kinase n=1 Tax=Microbacterium sp. TaxID=51671 RepID=UPI0035B3A745
MTAPARAIVLIGPMGAGKTSVGKRVARTLDVPFFDTDAAIARAHGPIDQLFAEQGEAHFRALERAAVVEGLATGGVVSLGGGAVLDPETQSDLQRHRVVLLTVAPRVVAIRVRGSSRPLLRGEDDTMARWTAIYEQRRPIYERLAKASFDTSNGPLQGVVDRIVSWVHDDDHQGEA